MPISTTVPAKWPSASWPPGDGGPAAGSPAVRLSGSRPGAWVGTSRFGRVCRKAEAEYHALTGRWRVCWSGPDSGWTRRPRRAECWGTTTAPGRDTRHSAPGFLLRGDIVIAITISPNWRAGCLGYYNKRDKLGEGEGAGFFPDFPRHGKLFRGFSTAWKIFFHTVENPDGWL